MLWISLINAYHYNKEVMYNYELAAIYSWILIMPHNVLNNLHHSGFTRLKFHEDIVTIQPVLNYIKNTEMPLFVCNNEGLAIRCQATWKFLKKLTSLRGRRKADITTKLDTETLNSQLSKSLRFPLNRQNYLEEMYHIAYQTANLIVKDMQATNSESF